MHGLLPPLKTYCSRSIKHCQRCFHCHFHFLCKLVSMSISTESVRISCNVCLCFLAANLIYFAATCFLLRLCSYEHGIATLQKLQIVHCSSFVLTGTFVSPPQVTTCAQICLCVLNYSSCFHITCFDLFVDRPLSTVACPCESNRSFRQLSHNFG